jgi:predicted dehydrogenase
LKEKHVFCEKPMTLRYSDALAIEKLMREKKKEVFVDYVLTFSPGILKMISLLKESAIGNLKGFCIVLRQLGHFANNVYWDIGCHALSIVDLIEPLNLWSFEREDIFIRDEIIEAGELSLKYAKSKNQIIKGSVFLSFNHPVKERTITLYGDKGTLIYDSSKEKPLLLTQYQVDRNKSRDAINRVVSEFKLSEADTLERSVQYFYDCLIGKEKNNIKMANRIIKALERITKD